MIKAFADKKKTGGRKGISPFGGGQGEVSLLARICNYECSEDLYVAVIFIFQMS